MALHQSITTIGYTRFDETWLLQPLASSYQLFNMSDSYLFLSGTRPVVPAVDSAGRVSKNSDSSKRKRIKQ